ncbi:MAG: nicotinamide riboside transporter PnuC [Alphaproteobacteria bacterium]|nr:nicotinamide riboside transporter PnuC [Alphaproteobacteria bacterium]
MSMNIGFYTEILATVFGLTQGILIMQNKRSNWIFYILQIAMLIVFSAINHLYGDMTNNLIYLGMGIYGAILWGHGSSERPITKCTHLERIGYTLAIILGTLLVGTILRYTNDPLPMLDAFSTTSSFIATWYMVRRKLDAWIIWTINDLIYVVEYSLLPDAAYWLIGLNAIWTVMAILSYRNWKKIMIGGKK